MNTLDVVNGKLEANREQSMNFLTYLGWEFDDKHYFNPDHLNRVSSPIPECFLFFNPLKLVFENAALA